MIDRNALVGADLSDVIMQFDHSGMVFARNKMAKNKQMCIRDSVYSPSPVYQRSRTVQPVKVAKHGEAA